MGAKFGTITDDEKRGFATVDEMKDSLRPPRLVLVAPLPATRVAEFLTHADTAAKRYKPPLEEAAKESAELAAHRDDFSDSGYAQGTDAIAQKALKKIAVEFQTIGDCERIAVEQGPLHTRDACRSRAIDTIHKDPGVGASMAASDRLRFDPMPAPRLIANFKEALAAGDMARAALIEEVAEARDGTPRELSRQQRAEFGAYQERIDYGAAEVQIALSKIKIIAHRARLDLGLIPAREISRAKIRLGLMEMELAGLEKAAAKAAK